MQTDLFINGTWCGSRGGGPLDVINPATERAFHTCTAGTADDIDAAVAAAKTALTGPWRRTSGADRAAYLRAIASAIEAEKQTLAEIEVRDNGKPLPEALWDVGDAAYCFNLYANYAEELDDRQGAPIAVPDARFDTHVRYMPAAVAGLIVPWNYPLLMAAWKVAPALAAGCTMVLKPSEYTPLTALELARITAAVGLPAGVFNVVTGLGSIAGARLASHPGVRKLAFTGSVPTGISVAAAAARDVKSISLELGGKSPIVIFDDADIEQAVEWVMFGIFWNQGQVCSATSRMIVQKGIAPALLDRLKAEAKKITIGDGMTPGTLLGPLVSAQQYDKVALHRDRQKRSYVGNRWGAATAA